MNENTKFPGMNDYTAELTGKSDKSSQVVTIAPVLQKVQNYAKLVIHRIENELKKLNK